MNVGDVVYFYRNRKTHRGEIVERLKWGYDDAAMVKHHGDVRDLFKLKRLFPTVLECRLNAQKKMIKRAFKLLIKAETLNRSMRLQTAVDEGIAESKADAPKPCSNDGWNTDWLCHAGFRKIEGRWGFRSPDDMLEIKDGDWYVVAGSHYRLVPTPGTKGDVHRLCAALGVKLKGD